MMSVGDSIFARMVPYILTLALSVGEYSLRKKRNQNLGF